MITYIFIGSDYGSTKHHTLSGVHMKPPLVVCSMVPQNFSQWLGQTRLFVLELSATVVFICYVVTDTLRVIRRMLRGRDKDDE
jgi:hypothetical protein